MMCRTVVICMIINLTITIHHHGRIITTSALSNIAFTTRCNRGTNPILPTSKLSWNRKDNVLNSIYLSNNQESKTSLSSTAVSTSILTQTSESKQILIQESIKRAKDEHNDQFKIGSSVFGCSSDLVNDGTGNDGDNGVVAWSDEDFKSYQVKEGHAGPSEFLLKNGNIIYETTSPVLSEEDCDFFIKVAKQTIKDQRNIPTSNISDNEENTRKQVVSNSDLNEARLSQLPPEALQKLKGLLKNKLYPMLTSKFGMEDLTVYDGLILGHEVAPSRSQPVHRDASLLTLNIPLSSPQEFQGGGTYIEGLENHNGLPLCIDKGNVLCHSSGIMHAGTGITQGRRFVLVLFVIAKDEPQIARRCHAEGLLAISDERNLDKATTAFDAGLSVAPNDHLLHMGIGQIASIKSSIHGDDNSYEQISFECLAKAAKSYPPSLKASIAMGKMLLAKRKPRAALRRFDSVLSIIDDHDLIDGAFMTLKSQAWDARVSSVQCTLMCAGYWEENRGRFEQDMSKNVPSGMEIEAQYSRWSNKLRLEEAMKRLEKALIPMPADEHLNNLMVRTKQLLELSNV